MRILVNSRLISRKRSGSWMPTGGAPESSMTTAFSPLDPITAPRPPRPHTRLGTPSTSVLDIRADESCISPAGPIKARLALDPKRSRRTSARR